MFYIMILLTQAATLTASMYIWLGEKYLATMYGLHPLIAGAAALSLLLVPYIMAWAIRNRVANALDEQDDMIAAYQQEYGLASFDQDERWATQAASDFNEAVDIVAAIKQDDTKLTAAKDWLRLHPRKE